MIITEYHNFALVIIMVCMGTVLCNDQTVFFYQLSMGTRHMLCTDNVIYTQRRNVGVK